MALFRWRWKSVIVGAGTMAAVLYILGVLPGTESPFAQANSINDLKSEFNKNLGDTNNKVNEVAGRVAQIQRQLKEGQIRQLNNDLIDARRYQCRAINSQDKSALPFWNTRAQDLKWQFQQLTNYAWQDIPCNSF